MQNKKVAILGAGSWGTALAINCARVKNQHVYLWGHNISHIDELTKQRSNQRYLPDIPFPENLTATNDISVVYDCDMILMVVPSIAFNETLERIAPYFSQQAIGWAIKGFDKTSHDLLSKTFVKRFPDRDFAVIAGPSFAKEVAKGLPTAITIAGNTLKCANEYATFLHNQNLRTYTTDDIIGAQVGGALKNVIAIAAGISDGLGFGANTRAAIITRGLTEINRIAQKAGAKTDTLMGLSGIGDLMLTCTDDLSRNRRFGKLLGDGNSVEQALDIIGQTVEGLSTAKEAQSYAQKYNVRAPISEAIEGIVTGKINVETAMKQLLSHQPKPELD
ncbi:MAG: NAD(P)-dependent glycerol-3-phosphate dehydrogenase [Gammaproteobacteria bacterium]|nr:NAD(P)-dependent glycerol-3-phosphate dehydrogenase [Gammaproteobacteria bacterium]